ncbi:hypothetical protein SLA2020_527830 [Shorea laevis]
MSGEHHENAYSKRRCIEKQKTALNKRGFVEKHTSMLGCKAYSALIVSVSPPVEAKGTNFTSWMELIGTILEMGILARRGDKRGFGDLVKMEEKGDYKGKALDSCLVTTAAMGVLRERDEQENL